MSNGLTGDYDVVVEVGVGTVNRLLATVHQNSASQDASPKFLHSLTARIGKIPKRAKLELAEAVLSEYFSVDNFDVDRIPDDVLSNIQQNAAAAEAALTNLRRDFADAATSPVSSSSLADALTNVAAAITTVRGTADIQVGTPTLTLTTGSTMEISVHAQVRAHYAPDPGTAALPAPIHGEVRATFSAKYNPLGSTGKPAIEVKPSDDDNKIVFIPAAGTSLTASEATQIARQIRLFLRTKFKPMNAELPSDFPFKQFKSLVTGNSQAIALPLKLAGQIPAFALNSVDNLFIGSGEDFALAISRDFIGDTLQPTLNQIEQFSYTYKVTDDFFDTTVVAFHAWVSNAILDWDPGNIILIITGSAHVWGWAVSDADYDFTIKQKLTLTLDVASQAISLQAVGDPSISGLPPTYKDKAKPQIIEARDQAVANAKKLIQSALTTPRTTFNKALEVLRCSSEREVRGARNRTRWSHFARESCAVLARARSCGFSRDRGGKRAHRIQELDTGWDRRELRLVLGDQGSRSDCSSMERNCARREYPAPLRLPSNQATRTREAAVGGSAAGMPAGGRNADRFGVWDPRRIGRDDLQRWTPRLDSNHAGMVGRPDASNLGP